MRSRAYIDTLEKAGQALDSRHLLHSEFLDHKNGAQLVKGLLAAVEQGKLEMPQVMVCANDALAFGMIHELAKNNIRTPEDVELVGFDNVPEAHYSNPTLTTINPHVDDYAEHAVNFLIERIEGYKGSTRRYSSPCTVEVRQSCQL